MPASPRTAAGRALLRSHEPKNGKWQTRSPSLRDAIRAIEAEAAQQAAPLDVEALHRDLERLADDMDTEAGKTAVHQRSPAYFADRLRDVWRNARLAPAQPDWETLYTEEAERYARLSNLHAQCAPAQARPADASLPQPSDLRGLVTDPEWGKGHRDAKGPADAALREAIDVAYEAIASLQGVADWADIFFDQGIDERSVEGKNLRHLEFLLCKDAAVLAERLLAQQPTPAGTE